ncbi:tripartite tricarboxylate transporter TctB family protein [Streptomonospora litoralis]|uniref:Tripartite tricarboxylate transporter TctB family protein n=1 Tax=Streptomonospora litoralis TaxID=2498135 RepID=A0A4P6Q7A0_9ACTN|nr:tripartite tricarboxylate transporter TctB family protein [Streptomonospora litoralis]QBI54979.1 Tripartite tricarboxylate transporter TctB family protein [Streptomonospora litoralis]
MSSSTPSPTRARTGRSPSPDLILGLALIAVSLGFLAYTLGLSAQAAAWPRGVLALLLVLAVAITVRALRSPAVPGAAATAGTEPGTGTASDTDGSAPAPETATTGSARGDGEWSRRVLRGPALTLLVVVAYIALLQVIGFLPATALYLLGHLWFGGVRDWRILAGVVVGVVAFVQLLFVYQLSVPLPAGLLFE